MSILLIRFEISFRSLSDWKIFLQYKKNLVFAFTRFGNKNIYHFRILMLLNTWMQAVKIFMNVDFNPFYPFQQELFTIEFRTLIRKFISFKKSTALRWIWVLLLTKEFILKLFRSAVLLQTYVNKRNRAVIIFHRNLRLCIFPSFSHRILSAPAPFAIFRSAKLIHKTLMIRETKFP